jgi:peptide chain release factor 1
MGEDFVKMMKEFSDLALIVEQITAYKKIQLSISATKQMLSDKSLDVEMLEMATQELKALDEDLEKMQKQIKISLLPKEEDDSKNAIIEIRAGTGGDEAALFANDLFIIYQRYAERQNWKFEILNFASHHIHTSSSLDLNLAIGTYRILHAQSQSVID